MYRMKRGRLNKNMKYWLGVTGILLAIIMSLVSFFVYFHFGLRGVSIVFDKKSGFYDDSIDVNIGIEGFSINSPVFIKYNMNGNVLNTEGEDYNGAIRLEVPETAYDLYTLSAMACDNDGNCTEPVVKSYVLGHNIDEDATLKIINVNCSQNDLDDYYTGIMVGGATYDMYRDLTEEGEYVLGNYNNRGKKWMRDAYITMFDTDGASLIDQYGYLGVSGWTSSAYSTKSLKVSMYIEDGENFREETFKLRSGSQDQFSGNIRSSLVSRLAEESGFEGGVSTERVVVFLNGEFYGIFDMQDTFSEVNMQRKYGIEKKKNIRKYKSAEKFVFEAMGIENDLWMNLDSVEGRRRLEEEIDMDNFLKYYAIQILVNNTDWPTNNYGAWRYEGKDEGNNKYTDGRARFLLYDMDITYYSDENIQWFEGINEDAFISIMENKYGGRDSVFPKVMETEYYRNRFIEIMRELINGPFRTENVLKIIDEEAAKIDHQVELWSTPEEYEEWKQWIEIMRNDAATREQEVRNDILEYFDVVL